MAEALRSARFLQAEAAPGGNVAAKRRDHGAAVTALAVARDADALASGDSSGCIVVRSMRGG